MKGEAVALFDPCVIVYMKQEDREAKSPAFLKHTPKKDIGRICSSATNKSKSTWRKRANF